jgi:hypothetical protein
MLKVKICMIVVACALASSAFAGQGSGWPPHSASSPVPAGQGSGWPPHVARPAHFSIIISNPAG